MDYFFIHGGSIMWLYVLLIVVIIIFTIKTIIELFGRKHSDAVVETSLNSILFWGAISAGIGIFGHFYGIFIAMQEILKLKDTSPALVAQGYFLSGN